jgi:pimeloyl-ACP methyl ester carboxylesterase
MNAPARPPVRTHCRVTSRDGTSIAYESFGAGAPVILVTGGLDDGSENAALARELAGGFSVYNYARRGRGASGDTLPYALQREIEDIEALITMAGGKAHLYGVSSGGALVLEAALAGVDAAKLAVYEIPYDTTEGTDVQQRQYVDRLTALLSDGRRDDALELFMRLAGSPDEQIAGAKASPMWPRLQALAHTLAYDAACLRDRRPHPDRLAKIRQPTLIATGGSAGPFETAADVIARSIQRGERLRLDGQAHVADPKVLARALKRFFEG